MAGIPTRRRNRSRIPRLSTGAAVAPLRPQRRACRLEPCPATTLSFHQCRMLSFAPMDDLLASVRQFAQRYPLVQRGATVVIGVSGGPDSLCLLHLLRRLAPELGLRLHVAHLNHGLRGAEADADAAFVAELAAEWGLPCTVGRADVAALAAEPGVSRRGRAPGALSLPGRSGRSRRRARRRRRP